MPIVPTISMRHYGKGSQLRRAGLTEWRNSLLQMISPDRRAARITSNTIQHFIG